MQRSTEWNRAGFKFGGAGTEKAKGSVRRHDTVHDLQAQAQGTQNCYCTWNQYHLRKAKISNTLTYASGHGR
jgi:hypothetical protein